MKKQTRTNIWFAALKFIEVVGGGLFLYLANLLGNFLWMLDSAPPSVPIVVRIFLQTFIGGLVLVMSGMLLFCLGMILWLCAEAWIEQNWIWARQLARRKRR